MAHSRPDRIVVVTGASSGIGEACALRLSRSGFCVFAGVRRPQDGEALRAREARIRPLILDVTIQESIQAAREVVEEEAGPDGIAGLVNNAGIACAGPLEFLPLDLLRTQLDVNVVGAVAVAQAFLPLIRTGRGRIVNMGSIGGIAVTPFIGPYCASKFGLEALTDALRMELLPWGIEVSIIEPGGVATPIWAKGAEAFTAARERMDPQADTFYGSIMQAISRLTRTLEAQGAPPDLVARAVEHALTARKPRTRYIVGADARLRWMLQRLPDRLRDRLTLGRILKYSDPPG